MIPLRKIRLRAFVTDINNQLAWKCLKKTCLAAFVVDVADRLVDNEFNVKLTEDQVRIGLKRTFMYFPWFFILPPLLKSSQKFTFDGQMFWFFYYRKHPNTSLHLFVIDFTILNRFRTFRIFFFLRKCDFVTFSRNMIFLIEVSIVYITWYFYQELGRVSFYMHFVTFYLYLWNKTEFLWKRDFLSYYLPWCLTSI